MAPPSQPQPEPEDVSLFNDPTLSDIKIRQIYKGKVKDYFGHKAILSAHSTWFLKAFTGGFKEASQNTIELHDDDPQNFEYMLKFLYTTEMVIPSGATVKEGKQKIQCDILTPIGIYILADKYEIPRLLRHAMHQVETGMRIHRRLLNNDDDTVPSIVAAYYSSCARAQSAMGVVIAEGTMKHAGFWLSQGTHDDLKSVIIDYGHFATDLILAARSTGTLGVW